MLLAGTLIAALAVAMSAWADELTRSIWERLTATGT